MEHNSKLYSDEHNKANILNDYFQSQSFLNDKDVHLPAILPTSVTSDLNSIILATDEVESVLKILPVERLVFKHFYNHLRDNNILHVSSLQSGFIPGYSTINQLTYHYNVFCQALDEGKKSELSSVTIAKHSVVFGTTA